MLSIMFLMNNLGQSIYGTRLGSGFLAFMLPGVRWSWDFIFMYLRRCLRKKNSHVEDCRINSLPGPYSSTCTFPSREEKHRLQNGHSHSFHFGVLLKHKPSTHAIPLLPKKPNHFCPSLHSLPFFTPSTPALGKTPSSSSLSSINSSGSLN